MTVTVALTHHTAYEYDRPTTLGPHVFRLKPAPHCRTPIESYSLKILPEDHFINWQQDAFGNYLARVVFNKPTRHFSFSVDLTAPLHAINPFDFFVEEYAENFPFTYDEQTAVDVSAYTKNYEGNPALLDFVEPLLPKQPLRTVDFLVAVNQAVNNLVDYTIRLEPGVQTVVETLTEKTGSCRDSSWLLVEAFRAMGLAARFVSGYIVQLASDEKSLDGPSGPEQDFTDLHAWAEVYIPGAGWVGLDPTSGLFASEGHIPLACTPEPISAAPVTGGLDECEVTQFDFANEVTRIKELPRITKPYTEQTWTAVEQLANQVESALEQADIPLTMGGEPTFVAIDDYEAPEWNTEADGPHKRKLAHELFLKMEQEFTTQGIRHYGQGKWYPGEALPRWQYAAYWRKDGLPLWQHSDLLGAVTADYGYGATEAEQFSAQLLSILTLPIEARTTCYEDTLYHMWQEASLPQEVSPNDPKLLDKMSRLQFLQKMQRGIEQPVGYVIPLGYDDIHSQWLSTRWSFKREHCFLLPGDSPLGYRLPLESLQTTEPEILNDPSVLDAPLGQHVPHNRAKMTDKPIRTALAIEAREGRLYVFLPPTRSTEQFLHLLNALEQTAVQTGFKIILEGYEPPKDMRLHKFAVTPDPGVIEVNIHPASDWATLAKNTTKLYELARSCRLNTEKYMVDGRQTGTGGGNHVTLGAATPLASPFLKRPDVLRSFITFWQHHPSLSYLFSGQFIGPTSQAPRVDEARDELLYELELAFSQFPKGECDQPWLVDRLLRNLLVDLTGNTHRAEFCIDKLYSPDSATGRLGIVEFRGFEMPPHARMSLVQMLLLRALLVSFWHKPYHKPLARWGTQLHDKYMLPHYVREDLQQVCEYLQASGYMFKQEYFTPFFEFRFPKCGEAQFGSVHLALHSAIEPWHVMGEEASTQGTSRYVDSSLERVEIAIQNAEPNRYVVACNGRRVPLQPTATQGHFVAGVRFRAWQPPSALHPTIGVHAPLTFDVFDTWNNRSVGGITYHVAHPGGRAFDTFPVNGLEAEGRRIARFNDSGHSIHISQMTDEEGFTAPSATKYAEAVARTYLGNVTSVDEQTSTSTTRAEVKAQDESPFVIPAEEPLNPHYPMTLDLRRPVEFYSK